MLGLSPSCRTNTRLSASREWARISFPRWCSIWPRLWSAAAYKIGCMQLTANVLHSSYSFAAALKSPW